MYSIALTNLFSSSAGIMSVAKGPFALPVVIKTDLQYNKKTISHLSELKPGDHIKVNNQGYDHHILVEKVVSDEEVLVIHYAWGDGIHFNMTLTPTRPDMGEIKEEVIKLKPDHVTVLTYSNPPETVYSVEELFERARMRLGETRWELFTNNCEHLVNWSKTGIANSTQQQATQEIKKNSQRISQEVGLGPVGLVAGAIEAVKSYKQYHISTRHDSQ